MQQNEGAQARESLPERLYALLEDTTTVVRKDDDPVVSERQVGQLQVTEVLGYPTSDEAALEDDTAKVDLVFVDIAVDRKKVERQREAFQEVVDVYLEPDRLVQGPSYIEIAGVLGVEQETAFRFMAVGEVLGYWQVVSGKTLGLDDATAKQMAGQGILMISGLKQPE